MAVSPNFSGVPKTETLLISAANTNRDGSGTIVYSSAAPLQGRHINSVHFNGIGTLTAGSIRMFIDDGTGGVGHARLYQEIAIAGTVASGTAIAEAHDFVLPDGGLDLPSGYRLGFCINNAEYGHVTVDWGDL